MPVTRLHSYGSILSSSVSPGTNSASIFADEENRHLTRTLELPFPFHRTSSDCWHTDHARHIRTITSMSRQSFPSRALVVFALSSALSRSLLCVLLLYQYRPTFRCFENPVPELVFLPRRRGRSLRRRISTRAPRYFLRPQLHTYAACMAGVRFQLLWLRVATAAQTWFYLWHRAFAL